MYPFEEKKINDRLLLREFSNTHVSNDQMWHRDKENRTIIVVESGGWSFQKDNDLPMQLTEGDVITIKKEEWHRVIKGEGNLVVKVILEDVMTDADLEEDEFSYMIAQAAIDGKKTVKIGDKEYPVKMSKDKAKSILGEHCGCENKEQAEPLFDDYIATTRALHLWFHGAHHVTRGAGFIGDHVHLYGELYEKLQDDIDVIIEKAVSILEDERVACPARITEGALHILNEYPSPVDHTSLGIAANGKMLLGAYIKFLEVLRDGFKEAGALTLGLEDHIASTANAYESFLYMLQQREKSELQN